MTVNFIHLSTHSEYSLIDGLCRIKPLVSQARAQSLPAQALTDSCNLFAAVKFYKAAIAAGVKPILGAELVLTSASTDNSHRLLLLCQNNLGYRNLTQLISKAYLEGTRQKTPILQQAWLTPESTEGLIALSRAQFGNVGQALLQDNYQEAKQWVEQWQQLFPNRFYLELQKLGKSNEALYIARAVTLAQQQGLPLVATNDVCFLAKEDFQAHETRVCIHDGYQVDDPKRPQLYTPQQYLRSAEEMQQLFADTPEALQNTVEIAKRCNVELTLGKSYLPKFPTPKEQPVAEYLASLSEQGLAQRLKVLYPEQQQRQSKTAEYQQRLEIELEVINSMGFAGYFLIVADFISWAKNNKIPVGPGRGSGAGSLVAYALEITDLDPLAYDLLFERFLNPERVSMPDFDVDFCMDKRDLVIDYVAKRYGKDSVSQIITFGSMAAKAVVRDVGRVLGHPYGFVDKIAKLIPFELGITLDKALEQEESLRQRYHDEEEVRGLIDLARKLEGISRNAGKHAGGVVISPSLLTDFTPLYCEEGGSNLVSQFDKDDVESVGLVKFDFLGLRTLTIIDWACQTLKEIHNIEIDISRIPLVDEATFALLKACQTTAVFQLESRGMKDLIKRLQPDCFEDIVALVALFRPGPLQSGMVDDFINRKHGRAAVEYPHEDIVPVLKPTYGVILYQEQVMQIAQVLAAYSLGEADLLRRAMGKKKPEEMAKQRTIFVKGATGRGVAEQTAASIFDLMEKFAGYGFNKSHSAAYALVSYQTAWLKCHHPAAFMAAVLSSDMDNTEKVVNLVQECRTMELTVTPPAINASAYQFTINQQNDVIYGLGAIKGVGLAAIEGIVANRQAEGPFSGLANLCRRIDLRKANRRVLEALIKAGALDEFADDRASLMAGLDSAIQAAEQNSQNAQFGQGDLFADLSEDVCEQEQQAVAPWPDAQRLQGEKETLGLYLTGHPIDAYRAELKQFVSCNLSQVRPKKEETIIIAGLITATRTMRTRKGNRMAIVTLDDQTTRMDITLFPELYEATREKLQSDELVVVTGEASTDDYSGQTRIVAKDFMDWPEARGRFAKALRLTLAQANLDGKTIQQLQQLLAHASSEQGRCPVLINYQRSDWQVVLKCGANWMLTLQDNLFVELENLLGGTAVKLDY